MNKKLRLRLGTALLVLMLCFPSFSVLASTRTESVSVENEIAPRGPAYEWRYKFFNGKLYKRLYNIKSGEYVGSWVLVE